MPLGADGQLASIVETLYEAILRPAEWARFLDVLTDVFKAGVADFSHFHVERHDQTISRSVGLDGLQMRRYLEHFAARNPWVQAGHEQVPGHVVVGEQLVPQAMFERSEYYNDFLRPIDIAHVIGAGIRGNERQFTALSILRSKRRGTFDREEIALLEHVLPHLKRAVQIHERTVACSGHPLTAVADELSEGLIVLDSRGRPLLVNRAARSILSRTDALHLTRDGLRASPSLHDARLRQLVQSATSRPRLGAPGAGGMIAVPRAGRVRPLLLLVTPAGPADAWLDGSRQAAIVWLRDPDFTPLPPDEWLKLAFGLTPAEAAVAGLVLQGCDPKQAADRLGVSVHTTRSQLKAVLDKTGTHSQSELVRVSRSAVVPIPHTPSG